MSKSTIGILIIVLSLLSSNVITSTENVNLEIVEMFGGNEFNSVVDIQSAQGIYDRIFIVEQPGIIKIAFFNGSVQTFLDIRDRVDNNGGEMGLLGLAFDPSFIDNGLFYVDYTASTPERTVVSRFNSTDSLSSGIKSSETIILEVEQPYSNHNAGSIAFDDSNLLYITLGDGGSGGDPHDHGQNTLTLLGSILRINVTNSQNGEPYTIPSDNPFVGNPSGRDEIFAWGLRNPWRISYDKTSGNLFAGDVGQNWIEEVDIIENGGNYGWNTMEGTTCYNAESCDTTGFTPPIAEYNHSEGLSITGGYVWRTPNHELSGQYLYGDYGSGKIWSLDFSDENYGKTKELFDTRYAVTTFGIDNDGRVYFNDYATGKIYSFNQPPLTSPTSQSGTGSSTLTTSTIPSSELTSSLSQVDYNFSLLFLLSLTIFVIWKKKESST